MPTPKPEPSVAVGLVAALGLVAGCGHSRASVAAAPPAPVAAVPVDTPKTVVAAPQAKEPPKTEPVLPPQQAYLAGMMPLRATGADTFRLQHPTFDGRGVIIGILDSGIDPGLPGFQATSTGDPKLLDLRDFSGEGLVDLRPITPTPEGAVTVGTHPLTGFGRVARLAQPPYYGGVLRELPLGKMPAADLNANGRNTDEFAVVVAKSTTGWFVMTDADGDGSLEDDTPLYDFSVQRQIFTYAPPTRKGRPQGLSLAANLADDNGKPVLDFYFDNSGHGSHVAGIAAGHTMFGIKGFDGAAPGAQILGLKISNDARGGISVTGSMVRAMNYAADFAQRRGLPLVLNLSFGVGNEVEGAAAIDSLVDEFALKHPGVLFVISAGNDGPGVSTVGFPGSADLALTACALFPGVFAQPPDAPTPVPPDVLGWWSARGGELAKPDVCAPGVAYSNVPPWHIGEEISGGTSMAAPQISGLAALLQSALSQHSRPARAIELKQALIASARNVPAANAIDQGTGVPNVTAAYRWLIAGHQAGIYRVAALPDGGNRSRASGAYRRSGLESPGDTVQRFAISSVGGQAAARLLLESDAAWLRAPASVDLHGGPETVTFTYDPGLLKKPGLYVGTVRARSATDTLAGAVLSMVNTIIVPAPLDEPIKVREILAPGRLSRFFVNLPADHGGLTAHLYLPDRRSTATLYLFEPDGKPFRGGGSVDAGGDDSANVTLRVGTEDIVPGVYEVAVLAPPNGSTRYALDVSLPRLALTGSHQAGNLAVRNTGAVDQSGRVQFEVDGAVLDTQVVGSGSRPFNLKVGSPAWADRVAVDVSLTPALWNTITDFGLSVFDREGQLLSEGPMNYPFTRQLVKIDPEHRGQPLEIELFPAFAHFTPPESWTSGIRVTYLAPVPEPFPGSDVKINALAAGAGMRLTIPDKVSALTPPAGFKSLVRVTAFPEQGAPSVHREPR